MGLNIPNAREGAIDWVTDRLALWSDDPAGIGLAPAEVADLSTRAGAAAAARTNAQIARDTAQSATLDYHTQTDAMRDLAADLVATIKAFARKENDPNVYVRANVSPADPLSPLPPPQEPTITTAQLGGTGAITIHFDARAPGGGGGRGGGGGGGTVWQVWRQLDEQTQYTFVGVANARSKSFLDATIPAGTASVRYTVQGVRGSVIGPVSHPITVQFGGVRGVSGAGASASAA